MQGASKVLRVLAGFILSILLSGGVASAEKAAELAGTWILTIDTPRGVQHPTLVIDQNGELYSGVYNSRRGPIDIEAISRDGDHFTFPLVITIPIGDIEVNYSGAVSGDDMTGSVHSPRGEVPFTGKRSTAD